MLTVRLQRVGRKNDPSFRMVIIDSKRGVKSADYIEMVGFYNPRQKTVDVKADRIKHWISVGAKPTDTVHNILVNQKVIDAKKVNPLGKKTPILKEKEEVAETKTETKDEALEESSPKNSSSEEVKTEAETEESTIIEEPIEEEKSAPMPDVPTEESSAEPSSEEVEETKDDKKGEA